MKKIAFYVGNLARGGAQRVIVNLANYFNQKEYEVVLVTAKWEEGEYPYDDGVQRVLSDLTEQELSQNRLINFIRRLRKLRGLWKQERPDIIISFMGKSNLNAIASTRGLSIPVLVSVRSDPAREYGTFIQKLLAKRLFGLASGVVLQTEAARAFFPESIRRKSVILPNSINPCFIRERFQGERKKEIVSVGSIDANKNNEMLIRAFAEMAGEYAQWKLVFYGDGILRPKLEELAKELKLEKRITFAGKEPEIYNKIWDSGIFVLTSNAEGMPNALIEAMALGLAVIATDCPCGGPATLIQDGENGLLIPVGDVEALKRALKKLIDNESLANRLGKKAHEISISHSPDKVNKIWQNYIESKIVK